MNKVNSKAVLRWNLAASPSLPPVVKAKLLGRLRDRLTREGDLVIMSDQFRDQLRNREDCLQRLTALIAETLHEDKPRKASRPSRSSQRKVREAKNLHSQKKKMRKRPFDD